MLEDNVESEIGKDVNSSSNSPVYWNGIKLEPIESHTNHWGNSRLYTIEDVKAVHEFYETQLKKKDYHEAKVEEWEEGHPKEWLDNVIEYLIQEGDENLSKELQHQFYERRFGKRA